MSDIYLFRNNDHILSPDRWGREKVICFLLFLTMASYGPVINIIGQLRYVEIVIILIALPKLQEAWESCLSRERMIVSLFGLTAFAQLISDFYNGANPYNTIKRTTTYIIMMLLIVSFRWIIGDRRNRLQWILLGYSLSYVMVFYIGGAEGQLGEAYSDQPWRLGLGFAVTLAACTVASMNPKLRYFGPISLVLLAAVDVLEGARSTAVISLISGALSLGALTMGTLAPKPVSVASKWGMVVIAGLASALIYFMAIAATNAGLIPTAELQQKMEEQVNSPYGLLATGRPDTAAAIYAISKRPIMGFGSSGYDYDVYVYYSIVSMSQYSEVDSYEGLLQQQLNQEWELSIPSHSHIFGAWVDAGILGPISWFVVLWFSFSVLLQSIKFRSEWSSLFCFVAINNLWDLPFSPGPIRMDMALRIVILFFAVRMINFRALTFWN